MISLYEIEQDDIQNLHNTLRNAGKNFFSNDEHEARIKERIESEKNKENNETRKIF